MTPWLGSLVRRTPVTATYVGSVAVVAAVMELLGRDTGQRLKRELSTDLVHLRKSPALVLPASAFVLEEPQHALGLPVLALAMGSVERWRGGAAAAGTFAAGHLGATAVVAAGLAGGISAGWVDPSYRESVDVGVSYGAWALWGALGMRVPPRRRPWYVAASALLLGAGAGGRLSYSDAGHVVAWVIGLAAGRRLVSWDRSAPAAPLAPPATPSPAG
ncbi:MAG: hypothetical protein QOE84_760 [Actinomycetota bacterium]|nr:hypothetical protein [Actinomycetota bacterium]